MLPDLLNIYLPLQELQVYAKRKKVPASYLISNKMALSTAGGAFSIWFVSAVILWYLKIPTNEGIYLKV